MRLFLTLTAATLLLASCKDSKSSASEAPAKDAAPAKEMADKAPEAKAAAKEMTEKAPEAKAESNTPPDFTAGLAVGQWAEYKMPNNMMAKQEITAVSDAEYTLKTSMTMSGTALPAQETKIPRKAAAVAGATAAAGPKPKITREKVTVNGKEEIFQNPVDQV